MELIQLANGTEVIAGKTGTNSVSYFQGLIRGALASGEKIVVLDSNSSFRDLAKTHPQVQLINQEKINEPSKSNVIIFDLENPFGWISLKGQNLVDSFFHTASKDLSRVPMISEGAAFFLYWCKFKSLPNKLKRISLSIGDVALFCETTETAILQ